ncbi:hypothetical protein BC567DRAFT_219519 [Phyllosticta citribraziliensis]
MPCPLVSSQPPLLSRALRSMLIPPDGLEAAVHSRDGHVDIKLVEDPGAHVADNEIGVVGEVDEQGAHDAGRQGARGAGLLVGRGRERVLGAQPPLDAVDRARVAVDDCCDFRDGRVGREERGHELSLRLFHAGGHGEGVEGAVEGVWLNECGSAK